MMPEIPVSFVYLAPDGTEATDTQFIAVCSSVPRVGEMVVPHAGSKKVVVHQVYYAITAHPHVPRCFSMTPNVVLKEVRQ